VLEHAEEAPCAAADIKQTRLDTAPAAEEICQRDQRLSAHGVGGAEKENLHLVVIEPCRQVADVTSALVMEVAAVVAWVGRKIGLAGNIVPAVPPPSVDDAG
jgi:hypothetical protein